MEWKVAHESTMAVARSSECPPFVVVVTRRVAILYFSLHAFVHAAPASLAPLMEGAPLGL